MGKKDVNEEDEYNELVSYIDSNSPYKKKTLKTFAKKKMSVLEMGNLLGLKKTDRYWLVHRQHFKTEIFQGKMWVDVESFEKWYANQIKYHKVTGEPPGLELLEKSYSIHDISEMLGINSSVVYDLLKTQKIPTILVDYWKRVPKDDFWKWYRSQTRYQTKEDREKNSTIMEATISMPEMASLLGITRSQVYDILKKECYARVLETVVVCDRKRITKESFQKFLKEQTRYKLSPVSQYKEVALEQNQKLAEYRRRKIEKSGSRRNNGNLKYLTCQEAALIGRVSRTTILNWISSGRIKSVKVYGRVRIDRIEYEEWIERRSRLEEM